MIIRIVFHEKYECVFQGIAATRRRFRQCEIESRTALHCAFRPNSSAVPVDNALDSGETDPRSRKFCHRMESLEGPEELAGVGPGESGAVVTNEIGTGAGEERLAELATGRGGLRCAV